MNQRIFEETFSTKKSERNYLPQNTILWREIPTKQISEETSTKESLKKNVCQKTEDESLRKKYLKRNFSKRSKTHLHQKTE